MNNQKYKIKEEYKHLFKENIRDIIYYKSNGQYLNSALKGVSVSIETVFYFVFEKVKERIVLNLWDTTDVHTLSEAKKCLRNSIGFGNKVGDTATDEQLELCEKALNNEMIERTTIINWIDNFNGDDWLENLATKLGYKLESKSMNETNPLLNKAKNKTTITIRHTMGMLGDQGQYIFLYGGEKFKPSVNQIKLCLAILNMDSELAWNLLENENHKIPEPKIDPKKVIIVDPVVIKENEEQPETLTEEKTGEPLGVKLYEESEMIEIFKRWLGRASAEDFMHEQFIKGFKDDITHHSFGKDKIKTESTEEFYEGVKDGQVLSWNSQTNKREWIDPPKTFGENKPRALQIDDLYSDHKKISQHQFKYSLEFKSNKKVSIQLKGDSIQITEYDESGPVFAIMNYDFNAPLTPDQFQKLAIENDFEYYTKDQMIEKVNEWLKGVCFENHPPAYIKDEQDSFKKFINKK